jgi:hypothetical protein
MADLLFVRNDGLGAVGHIADGQFQLTQTIPVGPNGFAPNWTHIVAVGDQLLFVRNDGLGAVGHIAGGQFQLTQTIPVGPNGFAPNWSWIVSTNYLATDC